MAFIGWPWKVALSLTLYFVVVFFIFHELSAAQVKVPNVFLTVLIVGVLVHSIWAHKIINRKK